MARTALVEKYLTTELRFQFEAKKFTNFVVFSKDTLSFRCESCTSVNLFWLVYNRGTTPLFFKFFRVLFILF
jgi:hypothetical protein